MERKRTKGTGINAVVLIHPMRVLAHLYPRVLYIFLVKSGNNRPEMLPMGPISFGMAVEMKFVT